MTSLRIPTAEALYKATHKIDSIYTIQKNLIERISTEYVRTKTPFNYDTVLSLMFDEPLDVLLQHQLIDKGYNVSQRAYYQEHDKPWKWEIDISYQVCKL